MSQIGCVGYPVARFPAENGNRHYIVLQTMHTKRVENLGKWLILGPIMNWIQSSCTDLWPYQSNMFDQSVHLKDLLEGLDVRADGQTGII